jgi:DNA-binding NarL/FixJ family response regulator
MVRPDGEPLSRWSQAAFDQEAVFPGAQGVRIVLADDHALMRAGLRLLLEDEPGFQVVGEADDGPQAVDLTMARKPAVVITDMVMPGFDGIEVTRQILRHDAAIAVIILSMYESYRVEALKAGASAYLLKSCAPVKLIAAVKAVPRNSAKGNGGLSMPVSGDSLAQNGKSDRFRLLTPREREILRLLAEGKGNRDVADQLSRSVHTVETHRARILKKLQLHGAADLVLFAVRRGLVG